MEILKAAIEMEQEGEKFYLEQMEINENYGLKAVCSLLAKEEAKHKEILESRLDGRSAELRDEDLQKGIKEIYPEDEQFEIEIKAQPEQFDFYRMAMEKEQASIDFYKGLLGKSEDDEIKKTLLFLISQEKKHYDLFDEMSQMLRRADEWVESSEFGLRKEY
jgi:rubrerythrin